MIDAIYLKAHSTTASLKKKDAHRCIERTKGGLNSDSGLHASCDAAGCLIRVLRAAGSVCDYAGAAYLLPTLRLSRQFLLTEVMQQGFVQPYGVGEILPVFLIVTDQESWDVMTRNCIRSVTE